MKIPEEKFIGILCLSLKILAWFLLLFGIVSSFAIAAVIAPLMFLNRWSGVVVLFFFILVFLLINLVIKIAEIILRIKNKVAA